MQTRLPDIIFLDHTVNQPHKWVAYESHKAYSTLVRAHGLLDKCIALWRFFKGAGLCAVKWLISYEMIPAHVRLDRTGGNGVNFLKYATTHALKKIIKRQYTSSGTGFDIYQTLQEEGVYVFSLDRPSRDKIKSLAMPLFDDLKKRRAKTIGSGKQRDFSESRGQALLTENTALYQNIEEALKDAGLIDVCSRYIGYQTKLIDINPQINDETDGFWHKVFSDTSLSIPKTAYFHRDVSGGDLKLILYLNDVSLENGPFSFVLGTHKICYPKWAAWAAKANDQSGLSGCDLYNRRCFAALPKIFQKKASFGNDLQDGSDISTKLLQSEWKITAPQGSMILFDPKGIHRGGMVTKGERMVLTCVIGTACV